MEVLTEIVTLNHTQTVEWIDQPYLMEYIIFKSRKHYKHLTLWPVEEDFILPIPFYPLQYTPHSMVTLVLVLLDPMGSLV